MKQQTKDKFCNTILPWTMTIVTFGYIAAQLIRTVLING